jgi:hypothetical protein
MGKAKPKPKPPRAPNAGLMAFAGLHWELVETIIAIMDDLKTLDVATRGMADLMGQGDWAGMRRGAQALRSLADELDMNLQTLENAG